jgi:hypothetical protein
LTHQGQEGIQSGSVDVTGIELDSGGKQSRLIEALKAFSLAFSALSCSISFSIRALSLLTRKISFSVCCILIASSCMRLS